MTDLNPMNIESLPSHWILCRLGEISQLFVPMRDKPKRFDGDIPWLRIEDLDGKFAVDSKSNQRVSQQTIDDMLLRVYPKGTVLCSCSATIGVCAITQRELITNQTFIGIYPNSTLHNEFLYYYFLNQTNNLKKIGTGITIKYISRDKFENLLIPLPPLNEQKRIVVKIEELLSKIESIKHVLEETKIKLKQYRQSLLKSAFGGFLTNDWRNKHKCQSAYDFLLGIEEQRNKIKKSPSSKKQYQLFDLKEHDKIETWATARLENLIYIAGRIGWRGLKADEYVKHGPLFLSVYNLNYGENVDYTSVYHITRERYDESPEIQLMEKDILLVKDGAGIGKIGFVNFLPSEATVNSSLLVIRARECFVPKFLFYFFTGPDMYRLVRTKITGSATPHLFQRDIKKFIMSIPPLLEQEKIVEILEFQISTINKTELNISNNFRLLEKMKQTVLQQAFEGKLVPHDPNDKPAEILLEKIKQENEKVISRITKPRKKNGK